MGVTSSAALSALRRAKPWDILLFRINGGPDFVAIWIVTSEPFQDDQGGPWKKENPGESRNFDLQIKMYPMLVDEFEKPVKLNYENGMDQETGLTHKSYISGMVEITQDQYNIVAKKLIDRNIAQLR